MRLCDLSDAALKRAMQRQLGRGNATATANMLFRHVKTVWNIAWRHGLVDQPSKTLPCRKNRREPQCWSLAELGRIVGASARMPGRIGEVDAGVFWSALVLTVYATGARISALMATPALIFDARRGALLLPAEHLTQRCDQRHKLIPRASKALAALRAPQGGLGRLFDDWAFDRTARQWKCLNQRLRQIIVDAGLAKSADDVDRYDLCHKIRRTFATFVARESSTETACALLGHSEISVTRRYLDKRFLKLPNARDLLPALAEPLGPGSRRMA